MLKKFLITSFLILTCLYETCNCPQAQSIPADQGRIVKVGISNSNFSNYYFNTVTVSATDSFRLVDKSKNEVLADFSAQDNIKISIKNNLFSIYQDDTELASGITGPVSVESEKGFVTVANLRRGGKEAMYRGTFELTKAPKKDNQFNVINVLDLESYLRGVVPNEMPVRFGLEALKAQSVAARNYVLRPREKNYHNFDVCDSVACQVYFGANTEKPLSDKAVAETANLVAMSDGELILALYSSTAGGYTESYENAFSTDMPDGTKYFPGEQKQFLKGRPDDAKTSCLNTEAAARKFYSSVPNTFDNASPYFRWKKEWTISELENVLKKTLVTQSKTGFVKPKLTKAEDFGSLKDIKVERRGVSGKAMTVNIITDKNIFNVQKELVIRRVFQKSNLSLPSANVFFDFVTQNNPQDPKAKPETKIVATGGGFGHGVGMSQFGAGMMNQMGYSYGEILQHYYRHCSIDTYPIVLSVQNGNNTATQVFYTKNKKTELVVENKVQFTKLIVVINGQELNIEISPKLFKNERIDISKYVKAGENRISYILPYSDLHKKPVRLYIEVKEAKND